MKADANISWLSGELTCGMNDEFNVKPPPQHKQKNTKAYNPGDSIRDLFGMVK